uniref:glycerophosphodiester phosphodiesterase GDPD5-like isoform X1 n=1 Tax=Styela clava TaxID=7725 RepID=UPI001939FA0E|nr:glycerophosphodiester phosphodiesterase GDPD5-like isoform X1 [Styela clava]
MTLLTQKVMILFLIICIIIGPVAPLESCDKRPLIIAHRGSCGMLPEHTKEAYELAIKQGADVIECDVAVSKDLKLLCAHESWLNLTTNVHFWPEFQNRSRTYFVPALGVNITDYFTIDFTLDELLSLKRVQVFKFRDQEMNGKYGMASLNDYISIAKNPHNAKTISIYVETKNPDFFNNFLQEHKTNMEDMLLEALSHHGYKDSTSPGFIESFSLKSLEYMSKRTTIPLVFLTKVPLSNGEMEEVANYASVICPEKSSIVEVNPKTNFVENVTDFVKRARHYGLKVHTYALRNEYQFLAYDYGADPYREYEVFISMGLDGMFTDFPWSLSNYLEMRDMSATTHHNVLSKFGSL